MKIFNELKYVKLSPYLEIVLNKYRIKRNFQKDDYIAKKTNYLNKYFSYYNLDTVIVPVSGGVDSALTLSLFDVARKKNNIIKNIYPIFIPANNSSGMTDQPDVLKQASELCKRLGYALNVIDLSPILSPIEKSVENITKVKPDSWSKGQLIPYLRTTILYYYSSILQQMGQKSVVAGTINADEGKYIGYVGKASDGMVDLQVLSDIHKSEVYQLAKYLNVPDSILNIAPKGELHDKRTDIEMFGFPYDFLELYLYYLTLEKNAQDLLIQEIKNNDEYHIWKQLEENILNLRSLNKHKYLGSSPAVHFDVLEMNIPDGWSYKNWKEESYV